MVGFSCHHLWWRCLQKPTAADGRRRADLLGRAQAGHSHLRGRGGGRAAGGGRRWARALVRRGGGLRHDGGDWYVLASGNGGQDDVADDPSCSSVPASCGLKGCLLVTTVLPPRDLGPRSFAVRYHGVWTCSMDRADGSTPWGRRRGHTTRAHAPGLRGRRP